MLDVKVSFLHTTYFTFPYLFFVIPYRFMAFHRCEHDGAAVGHFASPLFSLIPTLLVNRSITKRVRYGFVLIKGVMIFVVQKEPSGCACASIPW